MCSSHEQIAQVEVVPAPSSLDNISFARPRRRRCRLRRQLPAAPAGAAVTRNGSGKVYKSVQEQPSPGGGGSLAPSGSPEGPGGAGGLGVAGPLGEQVWEFAFEKAAGAD